MNRQEFETTLPCTYRMMRGGMKALIRARRYRLALQLEIEATAHGVYAFREREVEDMIIAQEEKYWAEEE